MTREDMMRDSNGKTEPVAGETPFEEDKVLLSDIIDTREIEPGETADGVEAGGAGQGSYEENERSTEETMVIESITKTSMGVLERGSKGEEMRGEWQEVQKSQRLETKKKSYKKDLAGADERDIRYLYELGREDRLGEEDGEECARIQPVQKEKMDNRKKAEKEEKSYEEKQEARIQGEFGSGMYGGFETAIKKVDVSMENKESDKVRQEEEKREAEQNEKAEMGVQERLQVMEIEIKYETIEAGEGQDESRKTQMAGQDEVQRETQRNEKSKDEEILPESVLTLNMGQYERTEQQVEEEGDVNKLREELDKEDKSKGSMTEDRDESVVIEESGEDGERERCLFEIEKEENNVYEGMRDTEILHEERWREESKINEEVAASGVDVGESVVVEEGDVDKLRDELDEENKNQGSVTEDRDESGVIKASREDGEREIPLFELEKEENNVYEGMRDTEILHEERWREESKIIEEVAVSWIDVGESETCEVNVQNLREGKNLEISVTELRDDRKHRENVYELKEHEIFDISTEVQPYENINIFHEALDMSKENETKSDLQQTVEPQINEDNIFGRNSHIIDLLKVAEEQETKKEERDNECPEKQSTILIVGETKDEGHVSDENVDIKTMEEGDGMDFNVAPATKSELIEGFSANIVTEGITLRDGWAIEKTEETINNDRSESGDTPYAVDRGAIRGAESGRDINESTMSTTEGQRPKIQLKIEKGVKLEEDEIFTKAKDIQSQFSDAKLHKTSEHRKLLAESTGQSRTIIVNEETDGNEGRKHITKDGVGKKRIRKRTHENEEEEFNLQLDSPSLDFTAQKSRIALKNRHIRAPKDPRILLQIPSLSPTSAPPTLDEEAATKPAGIKVGGVEMMRFKLPGIGAGFPVLKKTERRVEERGEEGTGQMTIKAPTPNLGPEDREPAGTKKWAAGSVGVKLPGFGPGMPALRKTDKGVKLIEKTTDDATVSPGKCDTSSGGGAERNGEESKEKGIKSVGPSTIKLPSFGAGFPMLRKTERGSKMRGEEGKTSEAERNETENNQPEKPGSDSPMLVSELKKKFMKTERK
nr:myosin-3-like isoform X2 [Paramormyrops kingsleyae]